MLTFGGGQNTNLLTAPSALRTFNNAVSVTLRTRSHICLLCGHHRRLNRQANSSEFIVPYCALRSEVNVFCQRTATSWREQFGVVCERDCNDGDTLNLEWRTLQLVAKPEHRGSGIVFFRCELSRVALRSVFLIQLPTKTWWWRVRPDNCPVALILGMDKRIVLLLFSMHG